MSNANAKKTSAVEPSAARDPVPQAPIRRSAAGLPQDQEPFLAQIPDLDSAVTPSVAEKLSEGRIISQALSVKLVLGIGAALVVGAILPFLFGKANRPVSELPAWASHAEAARIAEKPAQTIAPAWQSWPSAPATAAVPRTPSAPPAILLPQPAQVGDVRPSALSEPSWRPPAVAAPAVPPLPAANNYAGPPVVSMNPPDNRGGYRGLDRPADPQTLQADNRNNPVDQYRAGDPRYDYRGNPIDAQPVRRDIPASEYSRDPRYDRAAGNYPAPAGPGSPLMPSNVPGPNTTNSYQNPEPGVARFDGNIATPPVRTSYDRTGSNPN